MSEEDRKSLPSRTIGQFDNPTYRLHKEGRLTASNFGAVIKRRPTTPCHSLVKQILYPFNICNDSVEYGKMNESLAIRRFEEMKGVKVEKSGLFIDCEYPFLGASPVGKKFLNEIKFIFFLIKPFYIVFIGLLGKDEIVEVKCLLKVSRLNLTLEEAVTRIPSFLLTEKISN